MAIIDSVPGVSVTVDVDGKALREWQNSKDEPEATSDICYVEATSNRCFTVTANLDKRMIFKQDCIVFCLYADGKYLTTRKAHPFWHTSKLVFASMRKGDEHKKFRFSALDIVSEDERSDDGGVNVHALGELRIEMYHAKRTERKRESGKRMRMRLEKLTTLARNVDASNGLTTISEKAIKGLSISHSTHFDDVPGRGPGGLQRHSNGFSAQPQYKHTNGPLIGTFVFRYRSAKALKSMPLVPRSPSRSSERQSAVALRQPQAVPIAPHPMPALSAVPALPDRRALSGFRALQVAARPTSALSALPALPVETDWGALPGLRASTTPPPMSASTASTASPDSSASPVSSASPNWPAPRALRAFGALPASRPWAGFGALPASQASLAFGTLPTSQPLPASGALPASQVLPDLGALPASQAMPAAPALPTASALQALMPLLTPHCRAQNADVAQTTDIAQNDNTAQNVGVAPDSQAGYRVGVKPKRRATYDDNPRPRKIARQSLGSDSYELNDDDDLEDVYDAFGFGEDFVERG